MPVSILLVKGHIMLAEALFIHGKLPSFRGSDVHFGQPTNILLLIFFFTDGVTHVKALEGGA